MNEGSEGVEVSFFYFFLLYFFLGGWGCIPRPSLRVHILFFVFLFCLGIFFESRINLSIFSLSLIFSLYILQNLGGSRDILCFCVLESVTIRIYRGIPLGKIWALFGTFCFCVFDPCLVCVLFVVEFNSLC